MVFFFFPPPGSRPETTKRRPGRLVLKWHPPGGGGGGAAGEWRSLSLNRGDDGARGAEMTVLPSVSGWWGDDELDAFRPSARVAVAGKNTLPGPGWLQVTLLLLIND